jgi:hypothetical protein
MGIYKPTWNNHERHAYSQMMMWRVFAGKRDVTVRELAKQAGVSQQTAATFLKANRPTGKREPQKR